MRLITISGFVIVLLMISGMTLFGDDHDISYNTVIVTDPLSTLLLGTEEKILYLPISIEHRIMSSVSLQADFAYINTPELQKDGGSYIIDLMDGTESSHYFNWGTGFNLYPLSLDLDGLSVGLRYYGKLIYNKDFTKQRYVSNGAITTGFNFVLDNGLTWRVRGGWPFIGDGDIKFLELGLGYAIGVKKEI
ncbi:hypothetical protein [Spirochaeta cellobiosiphila]|uniref:hypothetical protein n=1 Tax=Spirochaeta cellobiosiphila TaxID=504483 RepID=UPI000412DD9E|nr:hypothetical protein [Spirochaeta cellobiosiphila]